jgi:hypothetical protein
MAESVLEARFDQVVDAVATTLKESGFSRRGRVFRLVRDGNCAVVEFQRSLSRTRDHIRFTLNAGVVCGALLDDGPAAAAKARFIDAHLSERIGRFLPAPTDKWWELSASNDLESTIAEITQLLESGAVPHLQAHLTSNALVELWESGRSPGLTEGQRQRNLKELKAALAA